jgi:hypothetical protein
MKIKNDKDYDFIKALYRQAEKENKEYLRYNGQDWNLIQVKYNLEFYEQRFTEKSRS